MTKNNFLRLDHRALNGLEMIFLLLMTLTQMILNIKANLTR